MSYKALYRKYRPNKFEDVFGQNNIISILKKSVEMGKISHAYMFSGPRGSGKTSMAKLMARVINCQELKDGEPCFKCDNCLQIDNNSTDVIEIDAASNNGVDEIREIRNKVNLLPTSLKYKVYIIDEVHMLSQGAFNALLKTLEEPPSHIVFILATTEIYKIPVTILSRCQRYDFKKISEENIIRKLEYISKEEDILIDKEALELISSISEGGMRDAISILDQISSYKDKISQDDILDLSPTISEKMTEQFIEKMIKNEIIEVLENINLFNEKGKDFKKISDSILFYLKDLLISHKAPQYYEKKINRGKMVNMNKADVYNYIQLFNDIGKKISEYNNPKLIFEVEVLNYMDQSAEISTPITKEIEKIGETPKVVEKTGETPKVVEKKENSEDVKEIKKERQMKKIVDKEKINELIEIRINNAFVNAKKEQLIKIQKNWIQLKEFMVEDVRKNTLNLLSDAKIELASSEYLILSYPYQNLADQFNNSLLEMETIVEEFLKVKYKLIAIDFKKWNEEKEKYLQLVNKNMKKNLIMEEINYTMEISIEDASNDVVDLFGDIVEIR